MDTSGFYHQGFMLRAGQFVYAPGFSLMRELKDTYSYPVEGWMWYDSAEEAAAAFGVAVSEINLDLPLEEPGTFELLTVTFTQAAQDGQ